ncbi:hypothetical protein ACF1GY_22795 [Streptomyces sp. NPDC014684]|uniref:hypothetical protein n=1 Tax=Streptomyces sp. NPDC014684 TaxID=3364880 RepID=UPI0036FC57FB
MPPDMDERWLWLITKLSAAAVDVADSAVTISHPVDGPVFGLRFIREIIQEQQQMEVLLIAVLRQSGITWEVLAEAYGVTRQSLHRRLAAPVEEALMARGNQAPELQRVEQKTAFVAGTAERVFGDLEHLDQAVEVWHQRRAQPRWWVDASIPYP